MSARASQIETPTRRRAWRFVVLAYIVAGFVAYLPAVRTPFFLDDFLHVAMVDGTFPAHRSPFQLYDFVDDEVRGPLLARGLLPWWTHPRLTIRFFRPLSSALLWLDHRVFGHAPLPMHLHSLAWWACAVLAARALFRRSFDGRDRRIAIVATIAFALAPCHAMPLAWLANREALVSLTFGTLALGAYTRWRDLARARDGALSLLLFALALVGGGEYALCFGGYVVAIELALQQPLRRRLAGAAAFFLPAAGYLAVRGALGYHTAGSGFYSDPLHEPIAFLKNVPWRSVSLLADGWLTLDGAAWGPTWQKAGVVVAVLATAALLRVAIRRAFAGLDAESRKTATWLLTGSLLSLAPVLAVVPSMRLLGVATLGIAPVVAIVIVHAWFPDGAEEKGRAAELTRLAAILLGFAHLVHGPVTTWLDARQFRRDAVALVDRGAWLRDNVAGATEQRIGVVRGMAAVFFTAFAIEPDGAPPKRWTVLAQTGHVLALRKDAHTLDLIVGPDRALYPNGEGNLYRSADEPLHRGETVDVAGMHATVLETTSVGPRHVRFVFDDPSGTVWVNDAKQGMKRVDLPANGFGAPFDP